MNPLLHLHVRVEAHQITVAATGQLTALTAHMLPKVVIGTLRRYATASLHLNLSAITDIDYVGVMAIEDCEFETARRGVQLIVTCQQLNRQGKPGLRSGPRRNGWLRQTFNTGTICHRQTSLH